MTFKLLTSFTLDISDIILEFKLRFLFKYDIIDTIGRNSWKSDRKKVLSYQHLKYQC